jgi:chemotaxis protein histidine kinase CheA
MGIAAFREACLKLGGKVKVSTKEGQGTTFMITLPYSNLLQECK